MSLHPEIKQQYDEDMKRALYKILADRYRLSYLERAYLVSDIIEWLDTIIPNYIEIPQDYPDMNLYEKGYNDALYEIRKKVNES